MKKDIFLKRFTLFCLALSTAVSCAFKEEEDREEIERQNTQKVLEVLQTQSDSLDLSDKNVAVTFDPAEVGEYYLNVQWPSSIPKVKVEINGVVAGILSRSSGYEVLVKSGETQRVTLTAMNEIGNDLAMYSFITNAPEDLVVDSIYYPNQRELKYARIRITENGTIVTGARDLLIETQYLQVDAKKIEVEGGYLKNSHISTFEKSTLPMDFASTAGLIYIKVVGQAIGNLVINSVGLDGKNGQHGKDAELSSLDSLNGVDGQYKVSSFPGGKGPDRNSPFRCSASEVVKAQPGKDGLNGQDGTNGTDGSDSPAFQIDVLGEISEFSIYMLNRPGKGGAAGLGGKGTPAGTGGLIKKVTDCKVQEAGRAPNGVPGKNGADGKVGQHGSAGGLQSNLPQNKTKEETYLNHIL